MNKRTKERIAFIVQQTFNMNVSDHNPMDYDEGFLKWLKERAFTFRHRITSACCKLPLPISTEDIGKVFNKNFEEFKKEYEESIK